jgi:hypothetical protein
MSDCPLQHFVHFLSSSKATMTFVDATIDIIAPMFAVCASMCAVLDFYFFPMQIWFTEQKTKTGLSRIWFTRISKFSRAFSQLLSQSSPELTQSCSEFPTWSSLRSEESSIFGVLPIVYNDLVHRSPAEQSVAQQRTPAI